MLFKYHKKKLSFGAVKKYVTYIDFIGGFRIIYTFHYSEYNSIYLVEKTVCLSNVYKCNLKVGIN